MTDRFILTLHEHIGDFAEDKDWAAAFREQSIRPCLKMDATLILDFSGITLATQSFVHALISDILRGEGEEVLERLEFRGCVSGVKGIIETVVQYSLETTEDDEESLSSRTPSVPETPKTKKVKKKEKKRST